MIVCLLVFVGCSLAIDVFRHETFTSSDCSGNLFFTSPIALANICLKAGSVFNKFSCSPAQHQVFENADCSGDAFVTNSFQECKPGGLSGSVVQ